MAATLLTLILSFVGGALIWLVIGSRLSLAGAGDRNDQLNILCYSGAMVPIMFVLVLFVIERI